MFSHLCCKTIKHDNFLVRFFYDTKSDAGRKQNLNGWYFGKHHGNEYFKILTVIFNEFLTVVYDKQNLFFDVTYLADNEIERVQEVQGSQLLARAEVQRVFSYKLFV